MTEKIIERQFPVSQALLDLQKAVPESRIVYEDQDKGALPICTVDDKRQVISLDGQKGYDLWSESGDRCSAFGAPLEMAVAFLRGVPLKAIREMGEAK